MLVTIYCPYITQRLHYVCKFIWQQQLGLEFVLTTQYSGQPGQAIINYTQEFHPEAFTITPHGLLFQHHISPQCPQVIAFAHTRALFPTNKPSDFPFDIFAATFYLISRYEEYLPHQTDDHGRFPHLLSLAWQQNFLLEPVVHYWIMALRDALQQKFPFLRFKKKTAQILLTYDIDIAFAYLGRSWFRLFMASLRDMYKGMWNEIYYRYRVCAKKASDPYDVFDWLHAWHIAHGLEAIYFFPTGRYGRYDRHIAPHHPMYRALINRISSRYPVGIHPTYRSFLNENKLKKEIQRLSAIIHQPVKLSRQHYIRLHIPETYRQLISAGITHDFSMGYPLHPGFRAGVADPYFWYDLEREQETQLLIYPFCCMDAWWVQQKYSPEQYAMQLWEMWRKVKTVSATFIPILHNVYVSTHPQFYEYRLAYQRAIQQIVADQ